LKFQHSPPSSLLYEQQEEMLFPLDIAELKAFALKEGFYSYIAGTAAAVLTSFQTRGIIPTCGIRIHNHKTTLPMKKGLSSSAAICVLVVQSFLQVYEQNYSMQEIMEIAYLGEMLTPSRCGRMDQCVVMGANAIGIMEFDGDSCLLRKLSCRSPLYFVVIDLKSSKDTVTILRELNDCFPYPQTETQALMHEYVQLIAQKIAPKACQAIEMGDAPLLGLIMTEAQAIFDRCAMPNCPSQLTSPLLHQVMTDQQLLNIGGVLAVKGVGSQGDGTAQILCANEETQAIVLEYFESQYGFDGFCLTIPVNQE
jgi:galactokinase